MKTHQLVSTSLVEPNASTDSAEGLEYDTESATWNGKIGVVMFLVFGVLLGAMLIADLLGHLFR